METEKVLKYLTILSLSLIYFFVDDLILFGQDSFNICIVIMDVLMTFCSMSGQTINLNKSKVFIFKNVPRRRAKRLSALSEILRLMILESILVFPFSMVEYTNNIFITWCLRKSNKDYRGGIAILYISLARKATLVQHVTSANPSYIMQTMELPISICDKLDRD